MNLAFRPHVLFMTLSVKLGLLFAKFVKVVVTPLTIYTCNCQFSMLFTSTLLTFLNLEAITPCAKLSIKGKSRQLSVNGAIRKNLPLQKPRWEKTKLTVRYSYYENISLVE